MLPKIKAPTASIRSRRTTLLTGCAIALAMAAAARPAQAAPPQFDPSRAFQGIASVISGSATVQQSGALDTITVNSSEAVINWAPLDTAAGGGPIVFLPDGRAGRFINGNVQDFTVLNRVVPTDATRAIRFDGTVESIVNDVSGGSVWFYSPGGIIAGPRAVFDVGNLVLSANDIVTANGLFGPGGEIRFRGGAGSISAIDIMAGAQITAQNRSLDNAYVALVAPRIVQRGTVDANGSIAYIAAEAADVTINNGLFDIGFVTGTTAGVAIDHSGTTTGPGEGSIGTNRIYLATVAKNDAVTMLVTGALGYTPAANASIDNGVVVLAAGYGVEDGAIATGPAGGGANITIGNAAFTSGVVARASNALVASPTSSGTLAFSGGADLHGDVSASLGSDTSETVSVGGSLLLGSGRGGQGGDARLFSDFEAGYGASQGEVLIAGDLLVDASAIGADEFGYGAGDGGDAIGGTAELSSSGGIVSVGGEAGIFADATGGDGDLSSGDADGGVALLSVSNGGNVRLNDLRVSASAFDNSDFEVVPLAGGAGTGGIAAIDVASGSLEADFVSIDADATGSVGGQSDGQNVANGSGGRATAGIVRLNSSGGAIDLADVTISAFAEGGNGGFLSPGGAAFGGSAELLVSGEGTLAIADDGSGSLRIEVGAFSGFGSSSGTAAGGEISLLVDGGGVDVESFVSLRAEGSGASADLVSGQANGGSIDLAVINGGLFGAADFFADVQADSGQASDSAGTATGGTIAVTAGEFSTIDFGDGFADLQADARGGSADFGGNATGGIVNLTAGGGTIAFGSLDISANGLAGVSFDGAATTGSGGTVAILVANGGVEAIGSLSGANLEAEADGEIGGFGEERLAAPFEGFAALAAPPPGGGDGGLGSGGSVSFVQTGGATTLEDLELSAEGDGGDGFDGGDAGDGVGGTVLLDIGGGSASILDLRLDADGQGGDAGYGNGQQLPGLAGNGFGGEATVLVRGAGASLVSGTIEIDAVGEGGEGYYGNGISGTDGGIGTGGSALFDAGEGTSVTAEQIDASAFGQGGDGGDVEYGYGQEGVLANEDAGSGGDAFGGSAIVRLGAGSFAIGEIDVDASAEGGFGGHVQSFFLSIDPASTGSGGNGGDAAAGFGLVQVGATEGVLGGIVVEVDGEGGAGGAGPVGGSGGSGTGGEGVFRVTGAGFAPTFVAVEAGGFGRDGSSGSTGAGGNGGDGIGGTARMEAVGEGAALTLNNVNLETDSSGGDGGDGASNAIGGRGGDGGSGTGGTLELFAELGAITINQGEGLGELSSFGFGGSAGDGGNGFDVGATGGDGGFGGDGAGGTVRLAVAGGSITAGDLGLVAVGHSGYGGSGGIGAGNGEAVPPVPETPAADGPLGRAAGGFVQILAEDHGESGAFGSIDLGNTIIEAEGFVDDGQFLDFAGRISIDDRSADPDGSIFLQSLVASARGLVGAPSQSVDSFSFFGTLDDPNGVLLFNFTTNEDTVVTLRTYSYAGGTNAAGQTIAPGGFDPILALFDGTGLLIDQNDDGGSANVPADPVTGSHYDTFLERPVVAGSYDVSVTAFSNFANGPNLSDGFEGGGEFDGRSQQFAFDVLGVDASVGPGGASSTFELDSTGPGAIRIGGDAIVTVGGDARFTATADEDGAIGGLEVGGLLDVNADGSILLTQPGDPAASSLIAADSITLFAGNRIAGADAGLESAFHTSLAANNDVAIGAVTAGGEIVISAGTTLDAGALEAGTAIALNAGTDLTVGSAVAGVGEGQRGDFVVDANANSFGGGTPLDSIVVVAGDTIRVTSSTDDLWAAGGLPRFSDGDGLVGPRFATANDDSGQPVGTQIGASFGTLSQAGLSAPFGALVGIVGETPVLLGANGTAVAPESGTLRLGYWDSNAGDNNGNIAFSIQAGASLLPGQGVISMNAGGTAEVGSARAGGDIAINAGGTLDIGTAEGAEIFLNAGSGLTLDTGAALGNFVANAGGSMALGTVTADDDIRLSASSDITATSLTAGYEIVVDAGGGATIGDATTLGLIGECGYGECGYGEESGDDIDVEANGGVTIGTADSAGSIFINSEDGSLAAGTLRADDDIFVDVLGTATIASAVVEGESGGNILSVDARDGVLLTTTDVTGDAFLAANQGGVTVTTDLGVSGVVEAFGEAILLNSLGNLTIDRAVATNGDIDIVGTGDLIADDLESVGDIRLTSTAASVVLDDVTTFGFAQEVGGREDAAIDPEVGNSVGSPGPGDVIVDAAIDITANGSVDARRNVAMAAGSLIRVSETSIDGVEIALTSDDIAVESGSRIGSSRTRLAEFTSTASTGRTRVGGVEGDVADYQLSQAELDRVFTDGDIVIRAPGLPGEDFPPEVFLDTLSLTANAGEGGRRLNPEGRFAIETPGSISVVGAADFTALTNDNQVELNADRISLAADTGSVRLRGEGDTLAGRLELTADMIIAGSADAIADIAAAASTDAITDRLGTNDGATNDGGYFQANAIRFSLGEGGAGDGLFIQNSGANGGSFADRRGFTANVVRIDTESSATRIVINGRIGAEGGFATGGDTIALVDLGESGFDPRSTINGCLIVGAQCGQVEPPPPPPPPPPPTPEVTGVIDFVEGSADADQGEGASSPTALVSLSDYESFGFEPLIDEPVTGAGNDDLWFIREGEEEDEEEDEDEEDEPQ